MVVGGGVGGLCTAAVLARYGVAVEVHESHAVPGGAAHSFERGGFSFDSGPSFYAGMSYPRGRSLNPLKQVLDLIDEPLPCKQYDGWTIYLPEGTFRCSVRGESYVEQLHRFGGEEAVQQFRALERAIKPLADASSALSFAAFRADLAAPLTLARGLGGMVEAGVFAQGPFRAVERLNGPFSTLLDEAGVTNPFLKRLLDLECFVLSGMDAASTLALEMAFMFSERGRPDAVLDYPVGGSGAIVDALVRGIEKNGGVVHCNSHVEEILVEGGRAVGVRVRGRGEVRAGHVVSNASVWDTAKLVQDPAARAGLAATARKAPKLDSFMHLHLGFDGDGLDADAIGIHHLCVNDWGAGIAGEQNVVNISIPTVLDPSQAPEGKHTAHVYYAANEPYELWEGMDRKSPEYKTLKEERAQRLWEGLEKAIPDIRERVEVELVGSPLTHQRYLRREGGTYGPGVVAGQQQWPTARTGVRNLLACGDSCFPGIGMPAVASSGFIAANTIVGVDRHLAMLDEMEAMAATVGA